MKDAGISNREYLALILAGGAGKDPFRQISCAVDAAGEIVFSRVLERFGEGGEEYDIQITGPGGRFEIWLGHGREYVAIRFSDKDPAADPLPDIPVTPAEVLESFQRWKSGPGVREAITNTPGGMIREYLPANDAEPPAPAADTPPSCQAADPSTP